MQQNFIQQYYLKAYKFTIGNVCESSKMPPRNMTVKHRLKYDLKSCPRKKLSRKIEREKNLRSKFIKITTDKLVEKSLHMCVGVLQNL